jgi:ATP-dependent DNA helicase DinG
MARRIEEVIAHAGVLVAESGTGTGKTFAYLVPALLSGKKVLISTGTRALQDQLFTRDLPLVREALGSAAHIALLKGRANYLCRYRLDRLETEAAGARYARELVKLRAWSRHTAGGDIAELAALPEDADVWPLVTSTAENCLGGECPDYDACHVNRARREALAADVVVVNHHLFCADLVLREEGFGQLLPGAQAVIFDEAHQLPEVASGFFGIAVSSHQVIGLCRDTLTEETRARSGVGGLLEAAQRVEKASADLRLAMGRDARRAAWDAEDGATRFAPALATLVTELRTLAAALEAAAPRAEGLANASRRASDLLDRLLTVSVNPPADYVAWFETGPRSYALRLTPLNVGGVFHERTAASQAAWVFTSATLSVNGDFSHFLNQLGLAQAETAVWPSPFDYARQALLYLPPELPPPNHPRYIEQVVAAARPVIEAAGGRTFFLFTSHRALSAAADLLAGRIDFPLLVQGHAPKGQLLERFRELGNAVLLGTASFWEGVDVRGEALSCVIIDKLPFATPDDPVLQARARALEETGGNAFREYQLPEAVIALKQGAGRLIRDVNDRGVLMLCDPRLLTRSYGRLFLDSLPPLARTDDLAEVEAFFARGDNASPVSRRQRIAGEA